ncbi:MAG: HypC/HybG/HupF family hydrogenase formation chaperone [bacterium]
MCLAVPGRIVEVDPRTRTGHAEVFGTVRPVNLAMLDEAGPGDWVLIQTGFAVEKIDEVQAQHTIRFYEEMSEAFEAGLAAEDVTDEP